MQYIALAIAPGIAIILFILYKDRYNKEPRQVLAISFILGCLAILPAIGFEGAFDKTLDGSVGGVAVFSWLVVGFSEEFSKFLGLRLYSYNQKAFDEPLDGIVYSVIVSMGFATVENIMYVTKYAQAGLGLEVGLRRMFLSVPAHASFGVIMGYFVGKAKFNSRNSFMLMLTGLLGAIFFHGAYDFFVFINQYSFVGRQAGNGMLAGGAIISLIIALVLSRKLIRSQQALSRQMFQDKEKDTTVPGA
ncbi:MAG TPA: PrsW family glutamic-type intramembrane protease [Chitinophagaceae bacterium]|nr:PrsW family glutamic-type intramembrane protease [Chitinophagaceae bacterium]